MRLIRQIARVCPAWFQGAFQGLNERQNRKNSFDCLIMSGSGLACSVHGPHQQGEVACRRLHEQFLMHILDATDVESVHAAGIELMREVPFDSLTPLPLHPLASFSPDAPTVTIHRFLL